jgi:hypothetical protein
VYFIRDSPKKRRPENDVNVYACLQVSVDARRDGGVRGRYRLQKRCANCTTLSAGRSGHPCDLQGVLRRYSEFAELHDNGPHCATLPNI